MGDIVTTFFIDTKNDQLQRLDVLFLLPRNLENSLTAISTSLLWEGTIKLASMKEKILEKRTEGHL